MWCLLHDSILVFKSVSKTSVRKGRIDFNQFNFNHHTKTQNRKASMRAI